MLAWITFGPGAMGQAGSPRAGSPALDAVCRLEPGDDQIEPQLELGVMVGAAGLRDDLGEVRKALSFGLEDRWWWAATTSGGLHGEASDLRERVSVGEARERTEGVQRRARREPGLSQDPQRDVDGFERGQRANRAPAHQGEHRRVFVREAAVGVKGRL